MQTKHRAALRNVMYLGTFLLAEKLGLTVLKRPVRLISVDGSGRRKPRAGGIRQEAAVELALP